jgi:DnaJ family protein C protein 7
LESAAEIKDVLDAIPDFAARRAAGEDGGETAKDADDPTSELDDELAEELKSVPDPEGLLLLLEKAAKIGECKDRGREAFKSGKHKEALSTYAEALRMSSGTPALEGLFLSNMCACEQALGQFADALSSAGTAVGVAPRYVKARSRLATIYVELGMYDDAVAAYGAMLELPLEATEASQSRAGLAAATQKAKQSHPVDWIKLLGVSPNASAAEMKKAYRQLALAHHPDKANKLGASAGVAKARAAISSKLFKHVGEANRVLTDATERMRWENARSKAERAARQASYATQSRATGFGHFDPYDRKRGAGSSYYDDFEEEAFSYDEYAAGEMYDDGYGW